MTDEAILHEYEKAFSLSEKMLLAVQNNEWDALIGFGKDYHALMEKIMANNLTPPDNIASVKKRTELIQSILNNDAKIMAQVKIRMEDLRSGVTSVDQAIKLNQAYRPG